MNEGKVKWDQISLSCSICQHSNAAYYNSKTMKFICEKCSPHIKPSKKLQPPLSDFLKEMKQMEKTVSYFVTNLPLYLENIKVFKLNLNTFLTDWEVLLQTHYKALCNLIGILDILKSQPTRL